MIIFNFYRERKMRMENEKPKVEREDGVNEEIFMGNIDGNILTWK